MRLSRKCNHRGNDEVGYVTCGMDTVAYVAVSGIPIRDGIVKRVGLGAYGDVCFRSEPWKKKELTR
jgi:hypothetical protein